MKEDLIALIDDEYISEAAEYTTAASKSRHLMPLFSVIAAAVLILLIGITVIHTAVINKNSETITQSPSSSDDHPQDHHTDGSDISSPQASSPSSLVPGEEIIVTPVNIMVYADGNEEGEQYVSMNTADAVRINTTYDPKKDDKRTDGIHLKVTYPGKRIDAACDNGTLASRTQGGFSSDTYLCSAESIEFIWRPKGVYDYWAQEAEITIHAFEGNRLYMYALLKISSVDENEFVAKVEKYESFSDEGGTELTAENTAEYYPGQETGVYAYDINDIGSGREIVPVPLRVHQPFSMRSGDPDAKPDSIEVRFSEAVPLIIRYPGKHLWIFESEIGITQFDPAEHPDKAEIPEYLEKAPYFGTYEDTYENETEIDPIGIINILCNRANNEYDDTNSSYRFRLLVSGEVDEKIRTYALADICIFKTKDDKNKISTVVVEKYEEHFAENGIPYTTEYTDPIELRTQRVFALCEETLKKDWTENEYEYKTRGTHQIIKQLFEEYPYLDDEKVAQLMILRRYCHFGFSSYIFPREEAIVAGKITKDHPRLSASDVDIIMERIKHQEETEPLTHDNYYSFREYIFEQFNSVAGAADTRSDPNGHLKNSISPLPARTTYKLSEGGYLVIDTYPYFGYAQRGFTKIYKTRNLTLNQLGEVDSGEYNTDELLYSFSYPEE